MKLDVPFNLNFSLCCGQVFRWKKIDTWWYGVVGDHVLKISQSDNVLDFEGADEEFIKNYFGLNDDLTEIKRCIDKDPYVAKALKKFEGLRIVRQNPWECLISFICATYKSIAAIELMLSKISLKFGEKKKFYDMDFFLFPSVERLALASQEDLCECGLGYRAKYVKATAKKIFEEKIDLDSLKATSYLEARQKLVEFAGVGLKVADCVLLFSLEKTEAFPVDVWIKRVILNHYKDSIEPDLAKNLQKHDSLTNSEYHKISSFAQSYFGKYAGYAQEYLYHYERSEC